MGLFELMIMNDELREMIMNNASIDELRNAAAELRHGHAPRSGHELRLRRHDDAG